MKVAVIVANGTEEIEALTVVDVVRRSSAKCDIIGLQKSVIGSHNIKIESDIVIENVDLLSYDALVIPGGMPGAVNIANENKVINALKTLYINNKLICAICAAPAVVFAKNKIATDKKMTCYPASEFINLIGENYLEKPVVVDKNVITANGPKSAIDFALTICSTLNLQPKF